MGRIKKTTNEETSVPMKLRTLKPLAGYVLIKPSDAETKTSSGIILPESAQEKPAMGEVLSVGEDLVLENGKTLKCPVKVGDKVYFKKWGGDEIKLEGKELKLVKFDDLMAILE
ncbi:MAG: co-chaperone GroES [Candidatus Daviesbacteria bacterium]|nr:co-chaperone GroES [Candidatus Daviesbacteria bacterium]